MLTAEEREELARVLAVGQRAMARIAGLRADIEELVESERKEESR